MRIYSAADEENLRARTLLKEWTDDGAISKEQQERLGQDTISDLRTTNIFLRLVLFVFTLFAVGAFMGLFFVGSRPSEQTSGVIFLFFAVACYVAAEVAVASAHLYHYGIEEALAACAVGFLCVGLFTVSDQVLSSQAHGIPILVPVVGVLASLWIWHRFNLWYAFLAAMIFSCLLPTYWTSSHPAQLAIVAAIYAIGLVCIVAARSSHRFDYLDTAYSIVEALLWLGIYLVLNLKISTLVFRGLWLGLGILPEADFARPFYWTTWVLIWCLPPVMLARGIRQKDRLVIAVGAIATILTFVSNKPYLGWQRHTWDPMLLGIVLTGAALFLRRWLAQGPNGVRHGFTASRLSTKDERWLNVGSAALGIVTPHLITPAPQASSPDFKFGGGTSDGGGASGDF